MPREADKLPFPTDTDSLWISTLDEIAVLLEQTYLPERDMMNREVVPLESSQLFSVK